MMHQYYSYFQYFSKTIPIGVSIIVIAYLIGYQLFIASTIIRFLTPTAGLLFFFTGILVGMMKLNNQLLLLV
ncbi:hypothetical protein [Methanosphaera stadtmanae]|uniref:hypothetical protein n=1 Tax=Methanosphaera stadtmanae TaxID=2317 RepID=UPI00267486FB|nr:hypothetical protein [Methanosphaera stadtmanae]